MKLVESIKENQLNVLNAYGFSVNKIEYTNNTDNYITYKMEIEKENKKAYISVLYDWKMHLIGLQITKNGTFHNETGDTFNESAFHSFVINTIYKYF